MELHWGCGVSRKPWKHQDDANAYARGLQHSAFLLEQRLGKIFIYWRWVRETILAERDTKARILVITPNDSLESWQDELTALNTPHVTLSGSQEERAGKILDAKERWFIVNPQGLYLPGHKTSGGKPKPVPSAICSLPFHYVCYDESAGLRNPQSITSKVCCMSFRNTWHRSILSGLPDPEDVLDWYQQMKFLYGSWFGHRNFWSFRDELFAEGESGYEWGPRKGTGSRIRTFLRAKTFQLTREEAGMKVKEIRERRSFDLPAAIRRHYDKVERDFETPEKWTDYVVAARTWLRRICGGRMPKEPKLQHDTKLKLLLKVCREEFPKKQVVVWFAFNREMKAAYRVFKAAGLKAVYIKGSVKKPVRRRRRERFQRGKVQYLFSQIKCNRYGSNFSAASIAIYFSMTDSYENFVQTKDRVVHLTKKGPILLLFLLARGTVEDDIYYSLTDKRMRRQAFRDDVLKRMKERLAKAA